MTDKQTEPVEILGSHMDTIDILLRQREGTPGDIIEFGVYAGATTKRLAGYGRIVWALDTFDGIPEDQFTAGLDVDGPGKFRPPSRTFAELFAIPDVIPVAAEFLVGLPAIEQFHSYVLRDWPRIILLAYLDCDLYRSAKTALDWLPDHMAPNAVIVLDDYDTHPGIRKAVNEFLVQHPNCRIENNEVIYWSE